MSEHVQPNSGDGLIRPDVSPADAVMIARERYGLTVEAVELGSNQDRNFELIGADGTRSVLRVDNPVFGDDARDAQHAAIDAYRAAGVPVAAVLPGLDGSLTQRWNGLAVRRSEFAAGESLVSAGYLAPPIIADFGRLAADSVLALEELAHPGLDRENPWDLRGAWSATQALSSAISDVALQKRVRAAAETARAALAPIAADLPVQAIHGDLTDDNVMARPDDDGRLHPHTLLDLGDLGTGWRIAELAVTISSLLHHEPDRPLRVLDAVSAYHACVPLEPGEARALWPLVVLRAAHLVASGWRQLEIDGDNAYARDRVAGEQAIFDAAVRFPLVEMTEQVLAEIGMPEASASADQRAASSDDPGTRLRSMLPDLAGEVLMLDAGIESEALAAGAWLSDGAEARLAEAALAEGAGAAVFPYGVFRLTRTRIDAPDAAPTWPTGTEIWCAGGDALAVAAPTAGRVRACTAGSVELELEDGLLLRITGCEPRVDAGEPVAAGTMLGRLPASAAPRRVWISIVRSDAPDLPAVEPGCAVFVTPDRAPAWARLTRDPAALLGLPSLIERDEAATELARREQIFASAQERYYERPMQIERGWRHHLVDTTGRAYVDMVNNVTGLGHGHPGVADAASRQLRLLATNNRFLYRDLAEYSERLIALLPPRHDGGEPLDTVLLVNSGSEAVDLAIRLAQAATGRKTVIALREAYHGWTMASDAVTTSAFDNPFALESRPDWIHIADVPNAYRGTHRGAQAGPRYAADLAREIGALESDGRAPAAFICESVLGNAGGVLLADGYLDQAYARVREAGGLCIADEVQVGFGRMGSTFWGFEQSGVYPDLITIAKPMGNGFPIGGVITSKRVADALAEQGQFFSSAGGNPVSCRVGIAVLDAMEAEGLQENARVVGERLRKGFLALAARHEIVGPVHGEGLYLGVELVRDRETREPATAEAAAICERLRELGVIVLTTSERSNVLKIKPPLCLTAESADFVLRQLDRVLAEGW